MNPPESVTNENIANRFFEFKNGLQQGRCNQFLNRDPFFLLHLDPEKTNLCFLLTTIGTIDKKFGYIGTGFPSAKVPL